MAGDESKKPTIPAWQMAGDDKQAADDKTTESKSTPSKATIVGKVQAESRLSPQKAMHDGAEAGEVAEESESSILERVQKFLAEPSVKSASMEKKRAFLEGKNINKDMIEKVLKEEAVKMPKVVFDSSEFKRATARPEVVRDVPPVVTYPEFLIAPQKPPPLITIKRLVNTAYITGGLAATLYGVSKFIVAPMTEGLTASRHDFAQHTEEQLGKLNEKLTHVVSSVPSSAQVRNGDVDSDLESVISDPTELFHRDMATQTSPPQSRKPSVTEDVSGLPSRSTIEKQEDRLKIMKSHMNELLDDSNDNGTHNDALQDGVSDLRKYLDSLMYAPPSTFENGIWQPAAHANKNKDDAVAAFRAEIRGVKGVLLNARRFPAGIGAASAKVGG